MARRAGWLLALCWWWLASGGGAAVSPPRWADPARNPCAAQPGGWQLLQWPGDGRCYRIFTVGPPGPCPPTQELAPHARTGAATCRCPPGHAMRRSLAPDGDRDGDGDRCYELFRRGPCPEGQYFSPLRPADGADDDRRLGECVPVERCDEGQLFWPATRRCYEALTRGPCPRGELLVGPSPPPPPAAAPADDGENDTDPAAAAAAPATAPSSAAADGDGDADDDGLARCACEPRGALASHFWAAGAGAGGGAGEGAGGGGGGACYEHFTRGPCLESGHLFLPGATCGCHDRLPHFHNDTGRCYPLGSAGPCPPGHRFELAPGEARARCRCKAGHVPWARDGACYRLYTRGPCPEGQFLLDGATCAALCQRGRLYFPERNICYRVGLRGPCPRGQVVLFEAAVRASVDGVSYRGTCGCPDGRSGGGGGGGGRDCSAAAAAAGGGGGPVYCDAKAGMVRWNGTCHALYTRGPCAPNQWLVPQREGRLLWDEAGWRRKQSAARCDCRPGYKPLRAPAPGAADGDLQCQPPAVSLAKFLNQKYHPDTDRGPDQWW